MKRLVGIVLGAVLILPSALGQDYGIGQTGEHVLNVSGVGTVLFEPDYGSLDFEAQGSVATVEEAKAQTDRIGGSFVARMEDLGVDSKDIRSDPMMIRQSTDRDGRTFINYRRRTYLILRDLDLFEDIEAAALESGITNIGEIRYSHSELDSLHDEALSRAFDDAADQARQAVEELDLSLGRVISVNVSQRPRLATIDLSYIPIALTAAPANRRTGQMQITRTVSITYRLLE